MKFDGSVVREGVPSASTSIAAVGLGKTVSDGDQQLHILSDIHLQINAGESLAIVGPSGCGKSTLLGLLAGLDLPTSGEVRWGDIAISSLDEEARAALRLGRLGFVFQSFQLMPQFTALENVMLPLELAGHADAGDRAAELLQRVGLADRLGHFPSTLSGGEQQRVAVARAFAIRPQILFADEPTGSLDAASGERVMELLFGLQREVGVTVVVVTHDPSLARQCSRQVRMEAGRIV